MPFWRRGWRKSGGSFRAATHNAQVPGSRSLAAWGWLSRQRSFLTMCSPAPLTFPQHRGIIQISEMNMKAAHRCRLRAVKREPGENPGRYSHCDGERFPRATGKLGRRKRAEPSQETCLSVESPICCLQIDLPACVFFGMRVPGKIFVARKSGCRRCSRFYISSDGVPGAFPEHKIFERR